MSMSDSEYLERKAHIESWGSNVTDEEKEDMRDQLDRDYYDENEDI